MSTDNIRERNRRNAQHSTGPRTAAGKAKSSRNALKHGFTGTMMSNKQERHELNIIDRQLRGQFHPDNLLEGEMIEKITWAIHQGNKLKVQLCDSERLLIAKLTAEATEPDATESTKLAVVRDHEPKLFHQVDLLRRYARAADRDFDRYARSLVWLQSQRKKEDRLQVSWEREEERREKNSRPDTYASAHHSMTRRYLEDRGIDPSQHAAQQRELQRRYEQRVHENQQQKEKEAKEKAYAERLEKERQMYEEISRKRFEQQRKEDEAADALPQDPDEFTYSYEVTDEQENERNEPRQS